MIITIPAPAGGDRRPDLDEREEKGCDPWSCPCSCLVVRVFLHNTAVMSSSHPQVCGRDLLNKAPKLLSVASARVRLTLRPRWGAPGVR